MIVNAAEKLATEVAEQLTKRAPDTAERLQKLMKELEQFQSTDVLQGVRDRLSSLQPEVLKVVSQNLEELSRTVTGTRLSALKTHVDGMVQGAATTAVITEKEAESFLTKAGDSIEKTMDSVLWESARKNLSRETKIAIGVGTGAVAVVAAGALLYKGAQWLFGQRKKQSSSAPEASPGSSSSLFTVRNAVLAGVGGVLLFFGVSYGKKLLDQFGQYGDLAKKSFEELEAMRKATMEQIAVLTGAGKDVPEELRKKLAELEGAIEDKKHTLSGEVRRDAEELYREKVVYNPAQREQGYADLRTYFEEHNLPLSLYDEFVAEMDEKYLNVPEGYAHPAVALHNYQINVQIMATEFVRIVRNHWVEATAIAAIAHRTGIDVTIFTGFKKGIRLGVQESLQVMKGLTRFGVKHPIISCSVIGVSGIGLYAAIQKLRGKTFLPENLPFITQFAVQDKALLLGEISEEAKKHIELIEQHAIEMGEIVGDFAHWATKNVASFVNEFAREIGPEIVGLTPGEVREYRNERAMQELSSTLKIQMESAKTERAQHDMVPKYQKCIEILGEYSTVFIRDRGQHIDANSTEPQERLQELEKALSDVGILLEIHDGIVYWKDEAEEEMLALSVDPSLTDPDDIYNRSNDLRSGESVASYSLSAGIQKLRELEQENALKLDFVKHKGIAMALGNFLYFVELDWSKGGPIDWDNVVEYAVVPLDLVLGSIADPDRDWTDWGATLTAGAVTTGMFALGTEPLRFMKRLAIGGGPLVNPKAALFGRKGASYMARQAVKVVPGVQHGMLVRDMRRGVEDFDLVRRQINQGSKTAGAIAYNFGRGRYLNNVLSRAGIRPEWIRTLEYGNYEDLTKLRKSMGMTENPKLLEELRTALKTEMLDRLKLAPRRELTWRNPKLLLFGGPGTDAQEVYDDVLKLMAGDSFDIANLPPALTRLRATYAGSALSMFDDALIHMEALGLAHSADDAAKIMKDASVVRVLGGGASDSLDAMKTAAQVGGARNIDAVKRCAQYIDALNDLGKKSSALLHADIIQEVCKTKMIRPDVAAKYFSNIPPAKLSKGVGYFRRQLAVIKSHPVMFGSAVALEAIGVGMAVYEIVEMRQRIAKVAADISTMLANAEHNGEKAFTKIQDGDEIVFRHNGNPNIRFNVTQIVDDGLYKLDNAAWFNLVTSGASLATTVLAPSIALGPAGLAVGAVVLTVHTVGGSVIRQQNEYAVLTRDLPMPILAMLGTSRVTGESNFVSIEKYSNWMIGLSERHRKDALKHLFIARFSTCLNTAAQSYPEVRQELFQGGDSFEFFSENGDFFKRDFVKIVAPYISMRMLQESNTATILGNRGASLTWGQAKSLSIMTNNDEWFAMIGLQADRIDEAALDHIIQESAFLYALHIRQIASRKKLFDLRQNLQQEQNQWGEDSVVHSEEELAMKAASQRTQEALQQAQVHQLRTIPFLGTNVGTLFDLQQEGVSKGGVSYGLHESEISRMVQNTYHRMNDALPNSATKADLRKQPNLATFTLPEYLLPERASRSIPLSQLYLEQLSSEMSPDALQSDQQYSAVLSQCSAMIDMLSPAGKIAADAYSITADEYNALLAYSHLLYALPHFDPFGIRHAIQNLPLSGWKFNTNSQSQHVMSRIARIFTLLQAQKESMSARQNEFYPPDTNSAALEVLQVGEFLNVPVPPTRLSDTAKEMEKQLNDILAHLTVTGEMILSEDGTHYLRKKRDGTLYDYKYYPQENGTVYAESLNEQQIDRIAIVRADGAVVWRDVIQGDRVHDFNINYAKEIFVRLPNGKEKRFEVRGSTTEFALPDGAGFVRYSPLKIPTDNGGTSELSQWSFEGRAAGTYYLFTKNHLGVEQTGKRIEVKENLDTRTEMLSGPGYHIYPHARFSCNVTIAGGEVIEIQEKKHRNMQETVEEFNEKLKGYIEVVPYTDVDLRYDSAKPVAEKVGWKFVLKENAWAIESFEITSSLDASSTVEVVDVSSSPDTTGVEALRLGNMPTEPSQDDITISASSIGVFRYPHADFTMNLTLHDGRTLTCTRDNGNEWQRYLSVLPSNRKTATDKTTVEGWDIMPRNREAVSRVEFVYPSGKKMTMNISSPQQTNDSASEERMNRAA